MEVNHVRPPGYSRGRSLDRARTPAYAPVMHRIFTTPFAAVYPLYVTKVERKGRTRAELDEAITWLTGFDQAELQHHLDAGTTFQDFFAAARLNPLADEVRGVICGVRIEEIEDPLMKQVRILDKLVDEIARGRPMQKVLRSS
jgi:hypothetical protein